MKVIPDCSAAQRELITSEQVEIMNCQGPQAHSGQK
jgi:hypothetical protein